MATDDGSGRSAVVDVLYVIFGLMPFLLLCVRKFCTKWDRKNDHVYEALRSPTVRGARNAFDRRVALALREAKQGATECRRCGFANSVRAAACVLCGATLPPKPKGLFRRKKKAPGEEDVVVLTDHQQRVRRRKEWARRVDERGRMVWVQDTSLQDAAFAGFPAYVLRAVRSPVLDKEEEDAVSMIEAALPVPLPQQYQPLPPSQPAHTTNTPRATPSSEQAQAEHTTITVDTEDPEEPGSPDEPEAPPEPEVTIVDVTQLLQNDLEALQVEIVATSDADASCVAFSTAEATPQVVQAIADTVQNALLPFPTKLAQFIMSMASVFNETTRSQETHERVISRFAIQRDQLLMESITAIATLSPQQARAAIRVDFVEEQGIDAGGVYREWFLLLNEAIVKPDAGIFYCVDEHNQTFYLNPHSRQLLGEHHLAHFLAAGRLVGRALLEGNVTGFHLALPLLKIMVGIPVSFQDLESFDPDAFKNLQWLLANDGVDMLGLDFTVVEKLPNGAIKVVELMPGGSEIDVTDANKREYVDAKLKYALVDSVKDQLYAFLRGVYEVVPAELMLLFDAAELDYILAGSDEIDVDDWEAHTTASPNITLHPAYSNFWKIVHALSTDEQRRLLQYATGSTRVPPGGFSALTSHDGRLCLFSLHGVLPNSTWGCIHAHACFNRLDIPLVRDIESLRGAVLAAVTSESVGFTTM